MCGRLIVVCGLCAVQTFDSSWPSSCDASTRVSTVTWHCWANYMSSTVDDPRWNWSIRAAWTSWSARQFPDTRPNDLGIYVYTVSQQEMKKALGGDANTAALAVVRLSQIFRPAADPLPAGAWNGQNLISWRWSPPLPTNPVWWGSIHAMSSYRGNRPQTHKHKTNKPTDRTDYNTLHC